jgi:hypothetical protein
VTCVTVVQAQAASSAWCNISGWIGEKKLGLLTNDERIADVFNDAENVRSVLPRTFAADIV